MKNSLILLKQQIDMISIEAGMGWHEDLHPRAKDGKFGAKSGDSGTKKPATSGKDSSSTSAKGSSSESLQKRAEAIRDKAIISTAKFLDRVSGAKDKRLKTEMNLALGSLVLAAAVGIAGAIAVKKSGKGVEIAKQAIKDVQKEMKKSKAESDLLHDKIIDIRSYAQGSKKGIEKEIKRSELCEDIVSGDLMDKAKEAELVKKHGREAVVFLNNFEKATDEMKETMMSYAEVQAGLKKEFQAIHSSLKNGEEAVESALKKGKETIERRKKANIQEAISKSDLRVAQDRYTEANLSSVIANIGTALILASLMTGLYDDATNGLRLVKSK